MPASLRILIPPCAALMAAALGGCFSPVSQDGGDEKPSAIAASVLGQTEKSFVDVTWKQRAGAGAPDASAKGVFVKKVSFGIWSGTNKFPTAWIVGTGALSGQQQRTNGIFYCQKQSSFCAEASFNVSANEKNSIAATTGPNDYSVYYSEGIGVGDVYKMNMSDLKTAKVRTGYHFLSAGTLSNLGPELWLTGENPYGRLYSTTGGAVVPSGWYAKSVSAAANSVPWIISNDGQVCNRPTGATNFTCMETKGTAVAAGRNNPSTIWMLGDDPVGVDGDFALYLYNGGKWIRANQSGKELAVDDQGYPWIVNSKVQLFQATGYSIKTYPTAYVNWYKADDAVASDIGAGPDNTVWIAGNDMLTGGTHTFKKYLGSMNWEPSNGTGFRLDVGPGGVPWVIGTNNKVYSAAAIKGNWDPIGSEYVRDIGVGKNGDVWGLSFNISGGDKANYCLLRWKDKVWTRFTAMGGSAIDVGPTGIPWLVTVQGDVYEVKADGSGWTLRPGVRAVDIGVGGNGAVYVVSDVRITAQGDRAIYRYENGGWTLCNGGGVRISVDNDGKPWLVNQAGAVYQAL